jgi:signal transduction histidine kinase
MSGFQIIGASIIFLHHFLIRDFPPELVFAFYLLFLILVFLGLVFPSKKIKPVIIAAKAVFCLVLIRKNFMPAFLLPSICLELADMAAGRKKTLTPLYFLSAAGLGSVLLIPKDSILYFMGFWAFTVYAAFRDQFRRQETEQLRSRLDVLKKELSDTETKHALYERAHTNQELMIKFQERDSIAQKLHDSLGHTITGSIMQLEAAELLFDDEPKRAKEIMLRVSGTLKDGLAAIRLNLKAIKPEPSLLGLQGIRGLLADFESRHGKKTELYTEAILIHYRESYGRSSKTT